MANKMVEAEMADSLHDAAPKLVTALTALDGVPWSYHGERRTGPEDSWPNQPINSFRLVRERDMIAISVTGDYHTARVTASPILPKAPDGTSRGKQLYLSDVLPYEGTKQAERPETSVALARLLAKPDQIAAVFLRKVITPYLALYPSIEAEIQQRRAGLEMRDSVVDTLIKRFGGRVSEQGGSNGSITIYTPKLPILVVGIGGRVMFSHSPTFSLDAMLAMLPVIAAEKSD